MQLPPAWPSGVCHPGEAQAGCHHVSPRAGSGCCPVHPCPAGTDSCPALWFYWLSCPGLWGAGLGGHTGHPCAQLQHWWHPQASRATVRGLSTGAGCVSQCDCPQTQGCHWCPHGSTYMPTPLHPRAQTNLPLLHLPPLLTGMALLRGSAARADQESHEKGSVPPAGHRGAPTG